MRIKSSINLGSLLGNEVGICPCCITLQMCGYA